MKVVLGPPKDPWLATYPVGRDAQRPIGFIGRALDGGVSYEEERPDGSILDSEVRIADSLVTIAEAPVGREQFPTAMLVCLPKADRANWCPLDESTITVRPWKEQRDGVRDSSGSEW